MSLPIQAGRQSRPQKTVIYGVEGIGKSTLATRWPKPLFLDAEDGTAALSIDRITIDSMQSYRDTINAILQGEAAGYKTLVLDTADWMFDYCANEAASELKIPDISQASYGQGYALARCKFDEVIYGLDAVLRETQMHIVVIAHAIANKVEMPGEQPYQQWSIKVRAGSGTVSKMGAKLREWADHVLFLNWNTTVVEGVGVCGKEAKIYTRRAAAYEAKNRCNLPEIIDRNSNDIATIWEGAKNTRNTTQEPVTSVCTTKSTPQIPTQANPSAIQQQLDRLMSKEQQADVLAYLNSKRKEPVNTFDELPAALMQAILSRPQDVIAKATQWKGGQASHD